MVYRSFKFYLLQAVAITFEDFVIYIAKGLFRLVGVEVRVGKGDGSWPEVVVRVVGYCWVTLWLCFSLPIWMDGLNAAGFSDFERWPVSQFLSDRWSHRA